MKKIPLTQGEYAIVDDEDLEYLNQWRWSCVDGKPNKYASGYRNGKFVFMHRLLNKTSSGMFTDHINGNGLDNRKVNLRTCTLSQNQWNRKTNKGNSSGYKGVSWNESVKKWHARIRVHYKLIQLGFYLDKEKAALAYNQAAKEHFGEFAFLNKV